MQRDTDAAVVTLLQDKVEVVQGQRRRILRPNEQARLSANAGIVVQTIDPAQVDGWLRFRNLSLGRVVAEANRYSSRKLRLGPLPDTQTVKLTFSRVARLRADLDHYAALRAQTYGEAADAVTLIPHALDAFMARDRAFKQLAS